MGRRLVVEADGGSRGNPGVAGYGALVRDPESGAVLAERAAPLGKQSNNVAEYTGLIEGLKAAALIDPGAVIRVRMDSKLVVEQMSGRWKIKHEDMRRLALEARDLVAGFTAAGGSVSYEWIPRADNKAADALSNDGMDGRTIVRDLTAGAAETAGPAATAALDVEGETDAVIDPEPAAEGPGPTRIVLVRHGVTAFTEQHLRDGRGGADPSLSATGREQAEQAARSVRALVGVGGARVITSELARARETGAAVAAATLIPDEFFLAQVQNPVDRLGRPVVVTSSPSAVTHYGRLLAMMSAFVGHPILAFCLAGVLSLVFTILGGGAASFRQYLAVASHAMLIPALGTIILLAANALGHGPVSFDLAILAPGPTRGGLALRVLAGIDPFMIWMLLVTAVGVAQLDGRRRWGSAAGTLLLLYLLFDLSTALFIA